MIVQAMEKDFPDIMALYRGAIGETGCAWDEHYPTMDMIHEDIARGNMYIMKIETGEIIAAAAMTHDADLANIPYFSRALEPSIGLMRLVVAKNYQNRGIAREMLAYLMEQAREAGYSGVRFLVGKNNVRAARSYRKLGFSVVGELEPEDLFGYRLLITSSTCAYRRKLEMVLQEKRKTALDTMEVGSITALKYYVEHGLGIALVPKIIVEHDRKGRCVRKISGSLVHMNLGILCKESAYPFQMASYKLYHYLKQALA